MVLLAGTQQTAFIVLGFFIFSRLFIDFFDGKKSADVAQKNIETDLLFAIVVAFFLYVVLFFIIHKQIGVSSDSRSSFVKLSEVIPRAALIWSLCGKLFFQSEPIISSLLKQYILFIYFVFLAFIGFEKPFMALSIFLISLSFYCGSILLVSVSGVWWPVPRALYGFGFALGLSFILILHSLSGIASKYFSLSVLIAAIGLAFHSSALLYDQIRLNRWDAWVASSVAQDLARIGTKAGDRVVLVGANWGHPMRLKTIDGDLNVSALAISWAAKHLFMEVTGREWSIESIPSSPECDGVNYWPNNEGIRNISEVFYVCMGKR